MSSAENELVIAEEPCSSKDTEVKERC